MGPWPLPRRPRWQRRCTGLWRAWLSAWVLALAACGPGRSDWQVDTTPSVTDTAVAISGTVAAQAPLIGWVEAVDALGVRKQALIEADGHYRLGLKGLTMPLLLRAVGEVAGRRRLLSSAATAEDVGGTVNITPFTDLIVANAAGCDSLTFAAAPDFSRLGSVQLDQARVMLTQRLAAVMAANAVDLRFDLRRSAFALDHTGFGAVLELLQVQVDPATRHATVTDLVSGAQVDDDLALPDDHQPLAAAEPAAYAAVLAARRAIDAVLGQLNTRLAGAAVPADDAALRALFDPGLRHAGMDLTRLLAEDRLRSSGNLGLQLVNPVITGYAADGNRLRVQVQVLDTLGQVIAYDEVDRDELEFRRDATGAWRIAGDRRWGDVSLTALNLWHVGDGPLPQQRALQPWVSSANQAVNWVSLEGPGLPGLRTLGSLGPRRGLWLQRRSDSRFDPLDDDGLPQALGSLPDCTEAARLVLCVDLASVPAEAAYTLRFHDAQGEQLGEATTLVLPQPPLPPALWPTRAASTLPAPAVAQPASFQALAAGVVPQLGWTLPTDAAWRLQLLSWSATVGGNTASGQQALSARQALASLPVWSGAVPDTAPEAWLWLRGPDERALVVRWSWP